MSIEIGQPAPDFELTSGSGQQVKLSDFRGENVIVYFYPKDMTPACTDQACGFRDRHTEFANADTVILGISTDSAARHAKFAEKYSLPFILLADEDHSVADQYGVWTQKNMYGRQYMGIERSTFIVDKEGRLVQAYRKVKVKGHVESVQKYVAEHLS
jgi:peroxiredoxin Q/BCP